MCSDSSDFGEYEARYIAEFKKDYYRYGKHDLDIQVNHLGRLAEHYVRRYKQLKSPHWTDCLKAHSLYNSAAARRPQLVGWKRKAFDIQKAYLGEWSDITYTQQTLLTDKLLTTLNTIRDSMRTELASADERANAFSIDQTHPADMMSAFTSCMQKNTIDCTDEMVKFAGLIIHESMKVLNREPPCNFSVVGLGSLARGETTPYSDLEYLFIVDQKSIEIEEYFERLAVTSYFLIGTLIETNLKYMHIKELQGWFEDQCKSGFKIEGLTPGAGNIPTGNGQDKQRNHFILTPAELVSRYNEKLSNPDKEEALKGDLTAMLAYTQTIYDHGEVGATHISFIRTNFHEPMTSLKREEINNKTLQSDVTKFNFTPDGKVHGKGYTVDVKREFYRFPSILLLDLAIVTDCVSDSAWATCDKLLSYGHITENFHCSLKFMLASACYMRLSSCLHLDSDAVNDGISVAPKILSISEDTNTRSLKWFMPVGLYTLLCQNLMLVRQGITNSLATLRNLRAENIGLPEEDNLWIFKFQALYSAGRFINCLHILHQEIGEHAAVEDVIEQFTEQNVATEDGSTLLDIIADVFVQCSKPRIAIKLFLHLNEKNDNDTSRYKLAECYESLGDHDNALTTLSRIENKAAEYNYLLGVVHSRQGKFVKAEQCLVKALQLFHNAAAQPLVYDYYGYQITTDIKVAKELADLRSSTAEQRLSLIQVANTDIIKWVSQLGIIHWRMGRPDLDSAYDKKRKELLTIVYGYESLVSSLANLYNSLAGHCFDAYDYDQSEQHYLRALEIFDNLYGPDTDHTDTAVVLSNLGALYNNKGAYSKAEDYNRRALCMYRNVYGETSTHEDIIRVMHNQTNNYKSQKQYSKAREVLDHTLVILREQHGVDRDHPNIAESLRSIGELHSDIKQYSTAHDYLNQALDMYQRIHEPDSNHQDIAVVLLNIGYNHYNKSDYNKAVEYYNRALVMSRDVYGTDSRHVNIANCLHNLGLCHETMTHYQEAEEYYQQALTMRREIYGEKTNHPDIARLLFSLGACHSDMTHYKEAEEYYQQALTMRREIYGEKTNHPDIANTLKGLGIENYHMGHYSKCVELYHQSLNMYREVYKADSNHTEVAHLLYNLGAAHKYMREYSTAEDYYYQSLVMYRAIYGADCNRADIADVLNNLAVCYDAAGEKDKANDKFIEALVMYRAVQPDHRDVNIISNYLRRRGITA